jgi:hypothetical protein
MLAIFLTVLLVANDQAKPPSAALPQLSQPLTSCERAFRKSDLAHTLGGVGDWLRNGAACAPPPSPSTGPTIWLRPTIRPTPPPPRYPF